MLASLRPQGPNAGRRSDSTTASLRRAAQRGSRVSAPNGFSGRVADTTGKLVELRNRATAAVSKSPALPNVAPGEGSSAVRRP